MKKITLVLVILVALLACAGVAYAQTTTVNGTNGNNWGPLSRHKHWPLPDDCGSSKIGDLLNGGDTSKTVRGRGGCDFVYAGGGDDRVHGGAMMDTLYGGSGNDRVYGGEMHDHLFGEGGNDYLGTRDGMDEPGHIEEVRGGPGTDRCWLDADSDGVKMNSCEYLNGSENPFPVEKYINTSDEGNHKEMRGEVNHYLSTHHK